MGNSLEKKEVRDCRDVKPGEDVFEFLRMYRTYNVRQKYMKFEILEYLRLTHSKSRCKEFERQLESYF